MSSNEYFTPPTALAPGTKARSADVNAISQAVDSAFDRLPGALAINTGTTTYAQAAGTGNAYTATLSNLITTYHDGMEVKLLPMRDNTGPATLNVNGIGNIPIKRHDGTDPVASDLMAASPVVLIYVAATNSFRMPPVADGQVAAAAASATAAAQAASAAAGSATTASQAASSTSGQVSVAAGHASAAAGSAAEAAGSATSAQGYAQAAQTAATQATTGQVQADWNVTDTVSKAFIKNKPAITSQDGSGSVYAMKGTNGEVQVGSDANGSLELGKSGRTVAGTPFIDFHTRAGSGDYDVRMIAATGGSNDGQGVLNVVASQFQFNSSHVLYLGSPEPVMARATVINAQDWSSITTNGVYSVAGSAMTNGPSGAYNFGTLVVSSSGNATTQTYYPHQQQSILVRTLWAGAGWQQWSNVVNSLNFNSYSPSLTGVGATGTWPISISGTAANTTSVSSATANGYTWTGTQIFLRNSGAGSTHATVSDFVLIANSSDGGTAGMSFVRSGQFAVNMALDPDNVIRIGGYSAAASRFQFDCTTGANSGNFTAAGNIAATSDERLKKNWVDPGEDFVERWASLKCGTYERIDTGAIQVGLPAQGVQAILDAAVNGGADGFLNLNYGGAAGVATVKLARMAVAQRAEIDRLKELVAILLKKAGIA